MSNEYKAMSNEYKAMSFFTRYSLLVTRYLLLIAHSSLLFSACGYSLVGRGTSLPPYLNSISIPIFLNKSGEPNIEFEITKYSLKPVAFDSKDNVMEYWLEISALIRLEDRVKENIILQQELYSKWDYKVSQSVTE